MLSRVADSIYWMCRYVERAENVARFISVNLNLNLDLPGQAVQQWRPLVVTTGDDALFTAGYESATKENVIRFLTFDRQNPNSVLSCLTSARENARSVREIISSEMWEHINRFFLMLKDTSGYRAALDNPYDFYEQVRLTEHFDACYSTHAFGAPKEDAVFWPRLSARESFEPERTLFVDDSLPVLDAAHEFGIAWLRAVRLPDTGHPPQDTGRYPAVDGVIDLM